ncbi:MAG: hypothetical protein OCC45_02390 [Desulfotalea sp.]
MKRLIGVLLVALSFVVTPVFADVNKGQKIFIKKMKKPCGLNGGEMAKKHTQAEWKEINDAGKLNEEMLKECPNAKPLKDSYVPHVYDFLYNYGSDSGNVPAC